MEELHPFPITAVGCFRCSDLQPLHISKHQLIVTEHPCVPSTSQGTARTAVPAQSSAPSHLRFPLGHLPAGKEGKQGKSHSTPLAIREEIQLSAAFQLPSQQPDTSEIRADGVCCHPVPWLSPAPPGAFICHERN